MEKVGNYDKTKDDRLSELHKVPKQDKTDMKIYISHRNQTCLDKI